MKIKIFLSVTFINLVSFTNAQVYLGVHATPQINYLSNSLDKNPAPNSSKQAVSFSYAFGIYTSWRVSKFEIGIAPSFANLKNSFSGEADKNGLTLVSENKINFKQLQFPLFVNYRVSKNKLSPLVGIGFEYFKMLSYTDVRNTLLDAHMPDIINSDDNISIEGKKWNRSSQVDNFNYDGYLDRFMYKMAGSSFFLHLGIDVQMGEKWILQCLLKPKMGFNDIENKENIGLTVTNVQPNLTYYNFWENSHYTRLFNSSYFDSHQTRPPTTIRNLGLQINFLYNIRK